MRTYHIIYKHSDSNITKGKNFTGLSPMNAYSQYLKEYGTICIFIGMYDIKEVAELNTNIQATQEAAEVDDVLRMNKQEYKKQDDEEDMTSLQYP